MRGFYVYQCTVNTLLQTLLVVLVTCHVLHALNPTADAVARDNSLSTMGLNKRVDARDDDAFFVTRKTKDHYKMKIRDSVVESTTSISNKNNNNMLSDPIFVKLDSIGSSNSRELQTCNICRYTIYNCNSGYMPDNTYGDESTYGVGDFQYSSSGTCFENQCCTTSDRQQYCCKLVSVPVSVPVSSPVSRPVSLPIPVPVPVSPPRPNQTNPMVYVAIGIIIPIVIGVVVAIICIVNRKKANEKKNTPVDTTADHTTVEQTRSAETTAQTTPIRIISITPPPPVMDVPSSIPMMQQDDISMFTEDHYSVRNGPNPNKVINVPDTYSTYGPVVDGSVVGESVMTTPYISTVSTNNYGKKHVTSNHSRASNASHHGDDDDVSEF